MIERRSASNFHFRVRVGAGAGAPISRAAQSDNLQRSLLAWIEPPERFHLREPLEQPLQPWHGGGKLADLNQCSFGQLANEGPMLSRGQASRYSGKCNGALNNACSAGQCTPGTTSWKKI